jgi:hypothetical protein
MIGRVGLWLPLATEEDPGSRRAEITDADSSNRSIDQNHC